MYTKYKRILHNYLILKGFKGSIMTNRKFSYIFLNLPYYYVGDISGLIICNDAYELLKMDTFIKIINEYEQ